MKRFKHKKYLSQSELAAHCKPHPPLGPDPPESATTVIDGRQRDAERHGPDEGGPSSTAAASSLTPGTSSLAVYASLVPEVPDVIRAAAGLPPQQRPVALVAAAASPPALGGVAGSGAGDSGAEASSASASGTGTSGAAASGAGDSGAEASINFEVMD